MNRWPSAYPPVLVTSGMTLADFRANIDYMWLDMHVHG